MTTLVCRELTVVRKGTPVLRRVSLRVEAASRTVLVGPSGAGKTTLLRAIAGLEPVAGGDVELGDRSLLRVPAHKRRISMVFQEPRLLPNLSVAENVALGLRAAGVKRSERLGRARSLLDRVGLGALAERDSRSLSGGEQQRVALARALCVEPDMLLLDEPLAGVDPNRRDGLRRLILGLQAERSLTTVLVTHDRTEAAELGERVALMLEGQIVQHDAPEALFERPASAAVARFFGSVNLIRGRVSDGRLTVARATIGVPGPDGEATFAIRPEHVVLDETAPLRLRVLESSYGGTRVRLMLANESVKLEAHVPTGDVPVAGEMVSVSLPLERLWRLPEDAIADEDAVRL